MTFVTDCTYIIDEQPQPHNWFCRRTPATAIRLFCSASSIQGSTRTTTPLTTTTTTAFATFSIKPHVYNATTTHSVPHQAHPCCASVHVHAKTITYTHIHTPKHMLMAMLTTTVMHAGTTELSQTCALVNMHSVLLAAAWLRGGSAGAASTASCSFCVNAMCVVIISRASPASHHICTIINNSLCFRRNSSKQSQDKQNKHSNTAAN